MSRFWQITAFLILLVAPAQAAELQSLGVTESAQIPRIQPEWRIPNDTNQIFYLQRSMNANTVVYAVRFDAAGNIDTRDPARIYWRRFNTGTEAKPLKSFEYLAYGIKSRKRDVPGEISVSLRRLPQVPMILKQTGPNKADLFVTIGGRQVRAVYGYAELEGSGLGQRVVGFSIHGIDPATGRAVSETFRVKGGEINQ